MLKNAKKHKANATKQCQTNKKQAKQRLAKKRKKANKGQQKNAMPKLSNVGKYLIHAPVGFVKEYMQIKDRSNDLKVKLRQVETPDPFVFSKASCKIGSEACLALDFGESALPGILVLGAKNPQQFSSAQGTDLLTFFATSYELLARRLLP